MKKNILKISFWSLTFLPTMAFAALDGIRGLLEAFASLLNKIIPVIFGLSLVYFFWGVAQFILHDAGNDKTREEGKKKILWGIIALFVFVSIYGILRFVGSLVDIPVGNSQNSNSSSLNLEEDI